MTNWKHDDLLTDLADHLRGSGRRMIWEDMQLGPSGSPRPDIFSLFTSYTRPTPLSYEVKVTRSDFLSDTRNEKWRSYLPYSAGVIFAVPNKLVNKDEIPAECGMIVRYENRWRSVKAPKLIDLVMPRDAWIKLLLDGLGRISESRNPEPRDPSNWLWSKKAGKLLGREVAMALLEGDRVVENVQKHREFLDEMRGKIKEAEAEFKDRKAQARVDIHKELEAEIRFIGKAYGIEGDTDSLEDIMRNVAHRWKHNAEELTKDVEIQRLRKIIANISAQVRRGEERPEDRLVADLTPKEKKHDLSTA